MHDDADAVTKDSILLDPITHFTYLSETDIDKHVMLDKFVKEEDKERFLRFKAHFEEGDAFYTWSWNPAPLCGHGGVCIFRNNRPIYAYGIWMS